MDLVKPKKEAEASTLFKLQAAFQLCRAMLLARFMSFDSLRKRFEVPLGANSSRSLPMVIDAVESASWRFSEQITCLPKALVISFLGRKAGINLELRIGVRRQDEEPQALEAHAWVELLPESVVVYGETDSTGRSYSQLY